MQELMDVMVDVYHDKQEVKGTALELFLPPNKVKKLLNTTGG